MTAAVIATNRRALGPLIKARLVAEFPTLPVAGLSEFIDVLDGRTAIATGFFVVYEGKTFDAQRQTLSQQFWTVIIVQAHAAGVDTDSAVGTLEARVERALGPGSGPLHADLKPLIQTADSSPAFDDNGMHFAFLSFAQPFK